jgi:hypothetical protein
VTRPVTVAAADAEVLDELGVLCVALAPHAVNVIDTAATRASITNEIVVGGRQTTAAANAR